MTAPAYIKTDKEGCLYSLYTAIQNQFSGWTGNLNPASLTISPLSWNQNVTYPLITLQDVGGPSLGPKGLGRELQEGYKGFEKQTQVEFNIYDQNQLTGTSSYTSAEQNVRRMRDLLEDFLVNAAYPGSTGAQIYPAIPLIDGNNGNALTGSQVWYEQETPGTWTETYMDNLAEMLNVKRYRIYARIHWFRYTSTPSGND
jgi:hypothetical protein